MELFSLDGEVAIVTGAGSGIGQSIAIGLAKAGAHVACFGHSSKGGLESTATQIVELGRKSLALEGSVTSAADLASAIGRAEAELGPLSIGVNNAGIGRVSPAESMSAEDWQKVYDVNVSGVFLSCQAEGRVMLGRGRGSIINIASMSATIVNRGIEQAAYTSAKAAVVHLSKSLAAEWADRGIRVNAISPGYTVTPLTSREDLRVQWPAFEKTIPMQRLAQSDEMAGPAIFLASRASSYVTGVDLIVDGGFVCW